MAAPSVIRPFEPRDREAVRKLCCDTGYLGRPIDPVFEDRELFADYLTSYYTDVEPESAFVLEAEGVVKGYLLGSRRPARQRRHDLLMNLRLFLRGLLRYPRYHAASKAFVRWILWQAWREVPEAPRGLPHFHFNLLPEVQSVSGTRRLVTAFLEHLVAHGETAVFGQVVTFEGRRGTQLFERYGFRVVARREITKYREHHQGAVFLCTVVKDLQDGTMMTGRPPRSARRSEVGG